MAGEQQGSDPASPRRSEASGISDIDEVDEAVELSPSYLKMLDMLDPAAQDPGLGLLSSKPVSNVASLDVKNGERTFPEAEKKPGSDTELSVLAPDIVSTRPASPSKAKRKSSCLLPRSPRQVAAEKKHLEKMRLGSPRSDVKIAVKAKEWVGSGGISGEDFRSPSRSPSPKQRVATVDTAPPAASPRAAPFRPRPETSESRLEQEAGPTISRKSRAASFRTERSTFSPRSPAKQRPKSQGGDVELVIRMESPPTSNSEAAAGPSYSSVVFPMPWNSSSPDFARGASDPFPACNLPPEPRPVPPVICPPIDGEVSTKTPKSAMRGSGSRVSGVRVPKFVPRPPPEENAWSAGICDCWHDGETCCVTGFAPCITFGRVAETVDDDLRSCLINGIVYCLLCVVGVSCCYASHYRGRLRQKYSLPGSSGSDFCVHCLCECCALAQEFQELKTQRSSGGYSQVELQSIVSPGWTRSDTPNKHVCIQEPAAEVVTLRPPPFARERGESSASASLRTSGAGPSRASTSTRAPSPAFMEKRCTLHS